MLVLICATLKLTYASYLSSYCMFWPEDGTKLDKARFNIFLFFVYFKII